MINEEFVDIKGYEGYYKINIHSDVYSLDRTIERGKNGDVFIKAIKIKSRINSNGYPSVGLSKNNKVIHYPLHRLIAQAFIPNPNNHLLVRHLNDIKTDNRIENLSWGTYKDNAQDSILNGTFSYTKKGKEHHWFGRKVTPNNKGLKGIDANNNKIILDTQTGIYYYGTEDAARAKNINANTLRAKLSGHSKNNLSLIYV